MAAACLAAQKQHDGILSYCLEQGAVFDRYLNRAAQMGAQSIVMLELLIEADWAGIRSDKEVLKQQVEHFGEESFQAKWLLANIGTNEPELNTETTEKLTRSGVQGEKLIETFSMQEPLEKKDKTKRRGSKTKTSNGGRDPFKGKGSRDPKHGPSASDIQKWFGDVPW
jgi:hypothetical protein